MNNFFNSLHTAFADNDFKKNTVGHLEYESTMYLCPAAYAVSIGPIL